MRWWSLISGLIAPHRLKSWGLFVSITSSNISDVGVTLVGLVIKHCWSCTSSSSNKTFPSMRSGCSLSIFRSPVMTIACFFKEAHMQISFNSSSTATKYWWFTCLTFGGRYILMNNISRFPSLTSTAKASNVLYVLGSFNSFEGIVEWK